MAIRVWNEQTKQFEDLRPEHKIQNQRIRPPGADRLTGDTTYNDRTNGADWCEDCDNPRQDCSCDICRDCDRHYDDCICNTCERCGVHYDDCDCCGDCESLREDCTCNEEN